MYILLPMDGENQEESSLSKLADVKIWAQICIEDGKLIKINFNSDQDAFENFSEVVIITNDNEYVWPFMEKSMMVLVAHIQRNIEDVVEAYLFKELHELAY
ncbi:MAG: hypothetical protein L3J10_01975 [Sulfurimonas sp.]|nr:hypothetical protein [Sulfurimonas sp.]